MDTAKYTFLMELLRKVGGLMGRRIIHLLRTEIYFKIKDFFSLIKFFIFSVFFFFKLILIVN